MPEQTIWEHTIGNLNSCNFCRCSAVYASNQQIQATVDISIFSESHSDNVLSDSDNALSDSDNALLQSDNVFLQSDNVLIPSQMMSYINEELPVIIDC